MDTSFRRDFCLVFWFCDRNFTTASEPVFLFLHISGKYVVVGAIHESPVCLSDFTLATEISCQRQSLSVFLSPQKEKLRKRKTAQGTAPRSEPRVAPANRDKIKIRGSMRLRPPETPKERVRPVAAATGAGCTAEKDSVFGAKDVCSASRADLAFPSEGKVAAEPTDEV